MLPIDRISSLSLGQKAQKIVPPRYNERTISAEAISPKAFRVIHAVQEAGEALPSIYRILQLARDDSGLPWMVTSEVRVPIPRPARVLADNTPSMMSTSRPMFHFTEEPEVLVGR